MFFFNYNNKGSIWGWVEPTRPLMECINIRSSAILLFTRVPEFDAKIVTNRICTHRHRYYDVSCMKFIHYYILHVCIYIYAYAYVVCIYIYTNVVSGGKYVFPIKPRMISGHIAIGRLRWIPWAVSGQRAANKATVFAVRKGFWVGGG
jgi:hypothetical protein